jgi:hypothetical protein
MRSCCLFLLLLLTGCDQYYDREYPHHIYAHNVRDKFIVEQQRADKNVEAYSTGGGMREHVERMEVGFTYRKILSLEEARVFFVKYNEWFRYRVNTQLKEYLEFYPAPIHEFKVELSLSDSKGKEPPSGIPCFAVLVQDSIKYCTRNPDPKAVRMYLPLYLEPYEEALEIVRREHPEVLPPEYLLPEEEARAISSAKDDPWSTGIIMIPTK